MELEKLKKIVDDIYDVVKHLDEPYNIEAFKIILEAFIGKNKQSSNLKDLNFSEESSHILDEQNSDQKTEDPIYVLATKCGVDKDKVKNVLDFENNEFILLKKIS